MDCRRQCGHRKHIHSMGAVSIDFGNTSVLASSSLDVGSVRKQSNLALGGPVWLLLICSLHS